jgi:molecular chaperone DnaK (HSP70)
MILPILKIRAPVTKISRVYIIFDRSSTSYNIFLQKDYHEIIIWNTQFLIQISEIFHNSKNYFNSAFFEIAFRESLLDIPNIIARFELEETQIIKKDVARIRITFTIDTNLIDFIIIQDMKILSRTTIIFIMG